MIARALVVFCLMAAVPALAQVSRQPGVQNLLTKPHAAPPPAPPADQQTAAPTTPVDQVSPYSTPQAAPVAPKVPPLTPPTRTASGKPPPVVQPPRNAHAQRPAPAKPPPPAAAPPPPVAAAPVPAPAPEQPPEQGKGSVTGLPLPRWASLRSDDVNLRAGPGTRYPVEWVYRRRDLPVEIEREFEVWRLVRDQDGVRGWVHQATLTGRRGFVVLGAEHTLRASAADDSNPVAQLEPGVVGRIRECAVGKAWCEMQVGEYRGWLKRNEVWGIYPDEAVN